jgi:hypothetical protein
MNVIGVGVKRVYYVRVRDDRGAHHDVPIEESAYAALKMLLDRGNGHYAKESVSRGPAPAADWMGALRDNVEKPAPKPVETMPEDLARKLASIGVVDEPDPGEVYRDAGVDDEEAASL